MTNPMTHHIPGPGPASQPARPIAAIAYLCTAHDPASAALYTAWCEQRATTAGWTLTRIITDPDDLTPLTERPGWQRVTQLLTDGSVGVVITVNRRMVAADSPAAWARLMDFLHGLGVILTTSSSTSAGTARMSGGAS